MKYSVWNPAYLIILVPIMLIIGLIYSNMQIEKDDISKQKVSVEDNNQVKEQFEKETNSEVSILAQDGSILYVEDSDEVKWELNGKEGILIEYSKIPKHK